MANKVYFPGIDKIAFEGTESKNPLAFRYFDPERLVMGKKMKDWLRFAMAWWHTLGQASGDQFGGQTHIACAFFQTLFLQGSSLLGIQRLAGDTAAVAALQKVQHPFAVISGGNGHIL